MGDFKVLVSVFLLAAVQCYHQCLAEQYYMENLRSYRTAPDILWITAKITVNIGGFHPENIYNPINRLAFNQYPARINWARPTPVWPGPVWSASLKPIAVGPVSREPNPAVQTTAEPDPVKPTPLVRNAQKKDPPEPTSLVPIGLEPEPVVPIAVEPTSAELPTVRLAPGGQLTPGPVDPTTFGTSKPLSLLGGTIIKEDPGPSKWTPTERPKFDVPGPNEAIGLVSREPNPAVQTTAEPDPVKPTPLVRNAQKTDPPEPTSPVPIGLEPEPVVPITVEPMSAKPPTMQVAAVGQMTPDPVDPTTVATVATTEALSSLEGTVVKEDPDPCQWTPTERPIFDAPGRRISEAKCYENLWDYQSLQEDEKFLTKYKCNKLTNVIKSDFSYGPKSMRRGSERYELRMFPKGPTYYVYSVLKVKTTLPGEFPHMGELGWRGAEEGEWKFQCGAILISEKFLLTAAHCSSVPSRDASIVNTKPEIVRLGIKTIYTWDRSKRDDYLIAQIIVHPQFAPPLKYYDIALVELKSEVIFGTYIWPACLWSQQDTSPLGNRSLITGWGYVDNAQTEVAGELQVSEVDMIDSVLCDKLLKPSFDRNFNGLQSHQLCAGELETGADACPGDSGAPLQVNIPSQKNLSYVIGVTSFGRGCGRKNSPGVYTRVSSFIDWIEDIVWPNGK